MNTCCKGRNLVRATLFALSTIATHVPTLSAADPQVGGYVYSEDVHRRNESAIGESSERISPPGYEDDVYVSTSVPAPPAASHTSAPTSPSTSSHSAASKNTAPAELPPTYTLQCYSCEANDYGLTGDWFGYRSAWERRGIDFQGDVTSFYYGVAAGGLDREFRFGGHGDYVLNFDGGKLGVQEGLFLKIRAEHRYGESINNATGALMPANVLADLPAADSEKIYITNFLVTQAFSENFAIFGGKLDTFDGDMNAYAHGRGKTQFSNMALVANPILLRTVPYSTLATGFVFLQDGAPVFTFTALNPTDTTKSSGISHLYEDGITLNAEGRIRTNFLGRQGHQLIGAAWSSKTYTSLGQDPRIVTGRVPIATSEGSWALYHNFDQQLVSDPCDENRGWGIFGRSGIGDADTNPMQYFLSFGVGGSSLLRGRELDRFGIGWYYLGSSSEIGPLLSRLEDGQGVETFYNWRVNSKVDVTPDMQVIMPGISGADTALAVGIRANIRL